MTNSTMLLLDTAGCGMEEAGDETADQGDQRSSAKGRALLGSSSKSNPGEAKVKSTIP
jgi:hypothetical protein